MPETEETEVPTIAGDWTYFGPECPKYGEPGFDWSCAHSERQFLSLKSFDDRNKDFYDEPGIRISCSGNRPSFTFDGGGPWIALGDPRLYVYDGRELDFDEAARFESDGGSSDLESIWFHHRDDREIIALIQDAERRGQDIGMSAFSDYDSATGFFDVTGFAVNYQRLTCSG